MLPSRGARVAHPRLCGLARIATVVEAWMHCHFFTVDVRMPDASQKKGW